MEWASWTTLIFNILSFYLVVKEWGNAEKLDWLWAFFLFFFQLAKKIREKFNRYLDVVNRNKQVVEASYTAHLTSPLTAIQDCCTIPPSMMEWVWNSGIPHAVIYLICEENEGFFVFSAALDKNGEGRTPKVPLILSSSSFPFLPHRCFMMGFKQERGISWKQ